MSRAVAWERRSQSDESLLSAFSFVRGAEVSILRREARVLPVSCLMTRLARLLESAASSGKSSAAVRAIMLEYATARLLDATSNESFCCKKQIMHLGGEDELEIFELSSFAASDTSETPKPKPKPRQQGHSIFITEPYGAAVYVSAYMLKSNAVMSVLLKRAIFDISRGDMSLRAKFNTVASKFNNANEISAQECAYQLLSMRVSKASRQVLFVNTSS